MEATTSVYNTQKLDDIALEYLSVGDWFLQGTEIKLRISADHLTKISNLIPILNPQNGLIEHWRPEVRVKKLYSVYIDGYPDDEQ